MKSTCQCVIVTPSFSLAVPMQAVLKDTTNAPQHTHAQGITTAGVQLETRLMQLTRCCFATSKRHSCGTSKLCPAFCMQTLQTPEMMYWQHDAALQEAAISIYTHL